MKHPCMQSGPDGGKCLNYENRTGCVCELKVDYLQSFGMNDAVRPVNFVHPSLRKDPPTNEPKKIKCAKCGGGPWPHDAKHFFKGRGLSKTCRECYRFKHRTTRTKKIANASAAIPKKQPVNKPKAPMRRKRHKGGAKIEFGPENDALAEKIKAYAEKDFRTFKHQVLYILQCWVEQRQEGRC